MWIATILAPMSLCVDVVFTYHKDIKPILAERCFRCHSSLEQEGGLRLDRFADVVAARDHGSAVIPGKSASSRLLEAIESKGELKMPPTGPRLTAAEITVIKKWIDQGAAEGDGRHWAFIPPTKSPPVQNFSEHHPIDAFLAGPMKEKGLQPLPRADKRTLLRRVTLDLIGIPPTPAEEQQFVDDDTPDAWEKVVDRLLASPRYGERWARHWMDVWRYSDWDGYGQEIRESQPNIWRWRDWIIESLNQDKGYDRMIQEMIAGDEIAPGNQEVARATGFLVRHWYKFNRNAWIDNAIEHTGKAFLGVTLNCARCHDHMYDPISQTDYYRFRAFFEPYDIRSDRLSRGVPTDLVARVYDAHIDRPTHLFVRGNEKNPVTDKSMTPGLPAFLQSLLPTITPIDLPVSEYYPGFHPWIRAEHLADARKQLDAKRSAVRAGDEVSIAELVAAEALFKSVAARLDADAALFGPTAPKDADQRARIAGQWERTAELLSQEARLARHKRDLAELERKFKSNSQDPNLKNQIEIAKAGVPAIEKMIDSARRSLSLTDAKYTKFSAEYPRKSTGRRTALAMALSSRDNPLTARVAINHIWLRHFGTPLVPTIFDFGSHGSKPTNQSLLDWLAVEFMDSGWSTKRIHRLMLTSAAFQRSSAHSAQHPNASIDPDNTNYWRFSLRRMDAEVVRDSLLSVSGSLDGRMNGPDLDPDDWVKDRRRSLYFRTSKEKRVTFIGIFDGPNVSECYRRSETVAPQQALAMENSPLVRNQSRRLAAILSQEQTQLGNPVEFVRLTFRRTLHRDPTPAECNSCVRFLDQQSQRLRNPQALSPFGPMPAQDHQAPAQDIQQRARESLVHVLLNHSDFVTIR